MKLKRTLIGLILAISFSVVMSLDINAQKEDEYIVYLPVVSHQIAYVHWPRE